MLHSRRLHRALLLAVAALVLLGCRSTGPSDAGLNHASPSPAASVTAPPSPTTVAIIMIPASTASCSPTPLPTPTQALTPAPTDTPQPTMTPAPTPAGLCGGRYPDKFTDEVVITDDSYQSPELAIFLSKAYDETSFSTFVTYFVADIYVQDVTLLKTASAGKDFTSIIIESVKKMAQNNNALFAASGDYYSHSRTGLIIRNGISYNKRPSTRFESCVLFKDGTIGFYEPEALDIDALLAAGAWQGWTFGPSLLDENGLPKTDMPQRYVGVHDKNPRCMLGYYEPGHYCLVVVDGRQPRKRYSDGLTLLELAQLAYDLKCTKAYNLDGGQSAQFYWQGQIYNHPTGGGRSISDILYFALPEAP